MGKTPKKALKKEDPSQKSITQWLSKSPNVSSPSRKGSENHAVSDENSLKYLRSKYQKKPKRKPLSITTRPLNKSSNDTKNTKHTKQSKVTVPGPSTRNSSSKKTQSKPKFTRFNSASSDELPSFKNIPPANKYKQSETYKKYGVIVPTFEEIIADRQKLSSYKLQVEQAQLIQEPQYSMPCSPIKDNVALDNVKPLDCKHLSLEDIKRHFDHNFTFMSDILSGKKFSARHKRFYDKNHVSNLCSEKDLTYNTSTIVFSFEQIDSMVNLMQEKFDPDDRKTSYFFKVLLPELCLKIFMDTHNMNKREAVTYLDERPI